MCDYSSSWKYSPKPVFTSTKELKAAAYELYKNFKDLRSFQAKYLRVQCQCHTISVGQHFRISVPAIKCSTCQTMGTSSSTPAAPPPPVVGSGSIETSTSESSGFHIVEFHGTSFSGGCNCPRRLHHHLYAPLLLHSLQKEKQ